jgi:signal transduction histidine kinase
MDVDAGLERQWEGELNGRALHSPDGDGDLSRDQRPAELPLSADHPARDERRHPRARTMTRSRLAARAWCAYLGVAALGTACYFLMPRVSRSGPLFNALGLSAAVAIVVGVRMHRPERRLPWYLFAVAQVLFVTGDLVYYTLPEVLHGYMVDFPSVGDIPYVAVYPLIIAGLLVLIHARNPQRDRAAIIDALIIGVGVGVVSWVYLMVPYARDEHLPLGTKALSITYPLMDVLVLAVTVRLAVDAGRRGTAFRLLVTGLVSLVVTDAAYGLIELNGTYRTGSWLDTGWLVYYFAWGAAALHPSMRTLSERVADPPRRLSRRRLGLLTAATLMSPVVQLTRIRPAQFIEEGVLVLASILLFLLVVARLRLVVRQHEDAEGRERALREAGAALVSAPTKDATIAVAIQATRQLAGAGAEVLICQADPNGDHPAGEAAPEGRPTGQLDETLHTLPHSARRDLLTGASVWLGAGRAGPVSALGVSPTSRLFIAPLVAQGALAGLLVVATPRTLEPRVRDGIDALAFQIALALEAASYMAERLHAEEALRRAAEEASSANHAKSDFLSRMSHELRTPLNAVLGYAQLLEMELVDRQRTQVQTISAAGRHLLELINDVLDISRIEAGQTNLLLEPVPIEAVLHEAAELIGPLAASRGITMTTERRVPTPGHVLADAQCLKQVLLNLLSNAVKYNRERGAISIRLEAGDARLRVGVTDTGPGIPREMIGRLFRPFDRLGAERSGVEGTGLGLAISHGLVAAMGGTIWAESGPEGSTFWMELEIVEEGVTDLIGSGSRQVDSGPHQPVEVETPPTPGQ